MEIKFGKHKGQEVKNLPKDYLQWLLKPKEGTFKVPQSVLEEARAALERVTEPQKTEFGFNETTVGLSKDTVLNLIDALRERISEM